MNGRIDWSNGTFEFLSDQDIEKMQIDLYGNNLPYSFCRYCIHQDCKSYAVQADKEAQVVFQELFSDASNKVLDWQDLKRYFTNKDKHLEVCVLIHLLQMIDEETELDISDEIVPQLLDKYQLKG